VHSTRIVLGAMTGTSLDGIDIVLAKIEGKGLAIRASIAAHASVPLGNLVPKLRAAAEQEPFSAGAFAALAMELGEFYAVHAATLCAQTGLHPSVACVHGQTIFHRPPLSWQIINPYPIAHALKCPVVSDLRGADLAEGGQGAPLTPLADWLLFRADRPRAIVNLGGFANASFLPAAATHSAPTAAAAVDTVTGADLCACNQLLDRAARLVLKAPYDANGSTAGRGTPNPSAVQEISERLSIAATTIATANHRSLGTGDEAWECLSTWTQRLSGTDLLASLAQAIGTTIGGTVGNHLRAHPSQPGQSPQIVLAGGGAHHAPLAGAIAAAAGVEVISSDHVGVPLGLREALAWAVLGALAADGQCATLPAVTGRRGKVLADGLWCFPAGVGLSHFAPS
jgi:1,6-anhydro-N-acetylmuramate kinase